MNGARFVRVEQRRKDLRGPFPPRFAARLKGQTVVRVDSPRQVPARGPVFGRHAIDAPRHVGILPRRARPRDARERRPARSRRLPHVVGGRRHLQRSAAVRHHGPADSAAACRDSPLSASGPSRCRRTSMPPRSPAPAAARRRRSKRRCWISASSPGWATFTSVEALHVAHLSPLRQASTIATASARRSPRRSVWPRRSTGARGGIARQSKARYRSGDRFRVYDRAGERCRAPVLRHDRPTHADRPHDLLTVRSASDRHVKMTAWEPQRRRHRRPTLARGRGDGTTHRAAAAGALAHPAIGYYTQPTHDLVAELNRRVEDGSARLDFDEGSGYLRPVLDALHVPVESQMLVMSKTGVQGLYAGRPTRARSSSTTRSRSATSAARRCSSSRSRIRSRASSSTPSNRSRRRGRRSNGGRPV